MSTRKSFGTFKLLATNPVALGVVCADRLAQIERNKAALLNHILDMREFSQLPNDNSSQQTQIDLVTLSANLPRDC